MKLLGCLEYFTAQENKNVTQVSHIMIVMPKLSLRMFYKYAIWASSFIFVLQTDGVFIKLCATAMFGWSCSFAGAADVAYNSA